MVIATTRYIHFHKNSRLQVKQVYLWLQSNSHGSFDYTELLNNTEVDFSISTFARIDAAYNIELNCNVCLILAAIIEKVATKLLIDQPNLHDFTISGITIKVFITTCICTSGGDGNAPSVSTCLLDSVVSI